MLNNDFGAVLFVTITTRNGLKKELNKEILKVKRHEKKSDLDDKSNGVVSILFAGDISLSKPIRKGNGSACKYSGLLANISKYFTSADYNMVNLEAPFVDRNMSTQMFQPDKGIHNMAWPEAIETLTSGNVTGVTISNNHITDFGGDAVLFTRDLLRNNNIDVIGMTTGKQPPYSNQEPLIKEIKGIKIGFLAYCTFCSEFRSGMKAGAALLDKKTVASDIPALKSRVDFVVLFLHWGTEYMAIPDESQREVALSLRKLGADVIIGNHPHVMQGHEWMNDTLVHYSLGNFVFHSHFTFMRALRGKRNKFASHEKYTEMSKISRSPTKMTELFKVEFTKKGVKDGYYLPVRTHVDPVTTCFYPRAKTEDNWLKVCGPEDENCYVPRPSEPIYH